MSPCFLHSLRGSFILFRHFSYICKAHAFPYLLISCFHVANDGFNVTFHSPPNSNSSKRNWPIPLSNPFNCLPPEQRRRSHPWWRTRSDSPRPALGRAKPRLHVSARPIPHHGLPIRSGLASHLPTLAVPTEPWGQLGHRPRTVHHPLQWRRSPWVVPSHEISSSRSACGWTSNVVHLALPSMPHLARHVDVFGFPCPGPPSGLDRVTLRSFLPWADVMDAIGVGARKAGGAARVPERDMRCQRGQVRVARHAL
jgi:hypothetical protein